MKNRLRSILWMAVTAAAALLLHCSLDTLTGGSEIGNPTQCTVVGKVVYEGSGKPVPNAVVHLRKFDFLRDTSIALAKTGDSRSDAFTDSSGAFVLKNVDTGSYCIEVSDGNSNGVLMNCDARTAVVTLPAGTLKPTVPITGIIASYTASLKANAFVQIYGLERLSRSDTTTGNFAINNVPEGEYRVRVLPASVEYTPREIDSIQVTSGTPKHLGMILLNPFSSWGHSQKLYLNTSATGANVSGNVYDFPLLVRLTRSNFNFDGVRYNAEDLRFTKSDTTPLRYEIERWDVANGLAEVWVRMDTVYGNDNGRYILMFWDKRVVTSESNPAAVFDTALHFSGVWHMNEIPSADGSVKDRTKNGYNASPQGAMSAAAVTEGMVGNCLDFDGTDDYLVLPTVTTDFTRGLTVSAWVRYRTFKMWSRIIDWCENGQQSNGIMLGNMGGSPDLEWNIWNADTGAGNPLDKAGFFDREQWVYVSATYTGTAMQVYKNGTLAASRPVVNTMVNVNRTTCYIGASNWAADSLFAGQMDELQVSKTVRTPDWIRLSYENQKTGSTLVKFSP